MSAFERRGRNALALFLGLLPPVHRKSPKSVIQALEKSAAPKILLIRPQQGLGDLLLATPLLRGLKERFPKAELHFLADTYNLRAVQHNRRLSHVWVWDKKRMHDPRALLKFIQTLRREKYELAIVLTSNQPSFTSFLLAKSTGARTLWAFDTKPFYDGANWSRWLAHVEVPAPREDAPEFDKFMALLKPLDVSTSFAPEFEIPEEDRAFAKVAWSRVQGHGPRIGVFLGGNPDRPDRLWPIEFWVELINRLENEFGATVIAVTPPPKILSGSGALEPGFYDAVAAGVLSPLHRFSDGPMSRSAAFLLGFKLFITPDGGMFHVSVASGVPTVGLFISSDPNKWAPPVPWASTLWAQGTPLALTPDQVIAHVRWRLQSPHSAAKS